MAASLSNALGLRRRFLSLPRNAIAIQAADARAFSSAGPLSEGTAPGPSSFAPPAMSVTGGKEGGSWSKLLLFLPGAITFGLGTWQIVRRQEKIEMIEHRRKRLGMEPITWSNKNCIGEDSEPMEFRKVECEGVFDESKSIFVGPRSRSICGLTENGYYVITPLIPPPSKPNSEQMPILVNRGWVPREWRNKVLNDQQDGSRELSPSAVKDSAKSDGRWWRFWAQKPEPAQNLQSQEQATNLVKVLGVIRGSENPSIFVPPNNPESGQWFYVDVPAMARSSGLLDHILYLEDINENTNASNPYPVPRDVNSLIRHSVMPQDHLSYTFTWYALSAAVTFMAVKRIRAKKGRR